MPDGTTGYPETVLLRLITSFKLTNKDGQQQLIKP